MRPAAQAKFFLESFQQRKAMYIQPVSIETAHSFLSGFYLACMACGLAADWDAWNKVVRERGWDTGAACPIPAMRASGMDEEATIDELITICREAIARSTTT